MSNIFAIGDIEIPSFDRIDSVSCRIYPEPEPLPGKRGICLTLRPEHQVGSWVQNLPKVLELEPYWNYSWGPQRAIFQPHDMEFVPMLWGYRDVNSLQQLLDETISPFIESGHTNRMLAFNEPDRLNQANMTVERAVELWPHLESLGISLISPGCADPGGEWMESFMAIAAASCFRVDWVSVHWYGGVSVQAFQSEMLSIYNKYGKPLLITEFAPADWSATSANNNRYTQQDVLAFAMAVLPWLEEQDWIAGYSWFSFSIDSPEGTSSALFDANNELTPLGSYYRSVTKENPSGDQSIGIQTRTFSWKK